MNLVNLAIEEFKTSGFKILMFKIKRRIWEELYRAQFYIQFKSLYFYQRLTQKTEAKTILCYPEKPHSYHSLFKICNYLGYKIINDPSLSADAYINFEDTTVRKNDTALIEIAKTKKIINSRCGDISKEAVDRVFKEVFGYSTMINPETFVGPCLQKSNTNAKHDGKIVQCPIKPKEGYVYQIIINIQNGKQYKDIRVPIMNGSIPVLFEKFRPAEHRFDEIELSRIISLEDTFSKKEIQDILLFCDKFGLDFGELDVLRNQDDNKIYIIDVNNTPSGPPKNSSKEDLRIALKLLTESFKENFILKV